MEFYDATMAYFNQMLEYRQSAGFATTTYRYTIPHFIEYSAANHPDALSITKCMVDEWLEYLIFIPTTRKPYSSQCYGGSPALSMFKAIMHTFQMKITQ